MRGEEMQNHTDGLKLLELTRSESDSDSPEFSLPKRKVRFKKRLRPNSKTKSTTGGEEACSCQCMKHVKLILNIVLIIVVAVLIWFVTNLNARVEDLQKLLDDFKTGNKDTPETFHNIHSKLKSLDADVSLFKEDLKTVSDKIETVSTEIKGLKMTTASLKESIATAPEIKQLPTEVHTLTERLANIGSKITVVDSKVKELKQQYTDLSTTIHSSGDNIDIIKKELSRLHSYIQDNLTARVENVEETTDSTKFGLPDDIYLNETAMQLINHTMTESEKQAFLKQNGVLTYNSLLNLTVTCVINSNTEIEHLKASVEKLTREFNEFHQTNTAAAATIKYLQESLQKLQSNGEKNSNESVSTTYQDTKNMNITNS